MSSDPCDIYSFALPTGSFLKHCFKKTTAGMLRK